MERKIGEIFEYNGEWYQCLKGTSCKECDFSTNNVTCDIHGEITCTRKGRNDDTSVIFKKLEKVGEPYEHYEKLYQCYKLPMETEIRLLPNNCYPIGKDNLVEIEIKQKEDMEEKKIQHYDCFFDKKKSNLKPFDIQKAREGKPVCTRDGRKARIICFDRKDIKPIVALVTFINGTSVIEKAFYYFEDGYHLSKNDNNIYDLMMLPEKKEGWVNVYKERIYSTKEEAIEATYDGATYVDTVKISWEE